MDFYFVLFVFIIAVAAAIGFSLLLVGYIGTVPGAIAHGWRWAAIALLIPVAGPFYFAMQHWQDCSLAGKQLLAGTALLAFAIVLLYGAGPLFAERILAGMR
jgi:hypothetical protein